jgi:Zn/Cd-binding protein ZinT
MSNLVRAQSQAMEDLERRKSTIENTTHDWKKIQVEKNTINFEKENDQEQINYKLKGPDCKPGP